MLTFRAENLLIHFINPVTCLKHFWDGSLVSQNPGSPNRPADLPTQASGTGRRDSVPKGGPSGALINNVRPLRARKAWPQSRWGNICAAFIVTYMFFIHSWSWIAVSANVSVVYAVVIVTRWVFVKFRIAGSDPSMVPQVWSLDRRFGFLSRRWEFCFAGALAALVAYVVTVHQAAQFESALATVNQRIAAKESDLAGLGLDALTALVGAHDSDGDGRLALGLLLGGLQGVQTTNNLADLSRTKTALTSAIDANGTGAFLSFLGMLILASVGGALYYRALKQRRLILAASCSMTVSEHPKH